MSNPKEKAKELIEKFMNAIVKGIVFTDDFNPERERKFIERAKQCALIAVDEVMKFMEGEDLESETAHYANSKAIVFWYKVREAINKL